MDKGLEEKIRLLGIELAEGKISRGMFVFRTLLRLQMESPEPLAFSEIYDAVNANDRESNYSKAWVHRLLKELVDRSLVRTIGDSSSRKQYVCDINSLRAGIERIRNDRIDEMNNLLEETNSALNALNALDPHILSNQLFAILTGEDDSPSSRFLTGMDEFHRVTEETIYSVAKEGDIIRCSVIDIGSFAGGVENRVGRLLTTPKLGAEIRYKVSSELFNPTHDDSIKRIPQEWLSGFLNDIVKMQGKGLDMRVARPGVRGYQFVSLNDKVMALMISDNPVTAAWVTRKFNASLIDNVISSFEKEWEEAVSFHKLRPEHLSAMGLGSNSYMASIFDSIRRSTES